MDLTPIIVRLKEQLAGFVLVGAAADLDIAIGTLTTPPAAFVLPLEDTAQPNDRLGVHHQLVTQRFAVVLVLSNLRDATGAAAAAELAVRRRALRDALAGWMPDAATGEPVNFTGGRLLQFEDQLLWWRDEWSLVYDYWKNP